MSDKDDVIVLTREEAEALYRHLVGRSFNFCDLANAHVKLQTFYYEKRGVENFYWEMSGNWKYDY